jgi:hypothetical protein
MEKKYIKPAATVEHIGLCHMVAASPGVDKNTVIGGESIQAPRQNEWDIWAKEEDEQLMEEEEMY